MTIKKKRTKTVRLVKLKLKAWAVFHGDGLPFGSVLEQDGDCPCHSLTYMAIPLLACDNKSCPCHTPTTSSNEGRRKLIINTQQWFDFESKGMDMGQFILDKKIEMVPYNQRDHSHCWEKTNPPCGQRIEHLRCCLCELPNPRIRSLNEIEEKCDCKNHKNQVCDICQGVAPTPPKQDNKRGELLLFLRRVRRAVHITSKINGV